jgi:RHS repeat-associated protein
MKPFLAIVLLLTSVLPLRAQTPVVVEYYHVDGLGSVRAVTDQSGAVVQRHDYAAFGEELPPQVVADKKLRFTGKERDAETGLDYFGARYYASGTGRFSTVDPAIDFHGAEANPQHWNRYAYVANNPVRWTDPDGRCVEVLTCTLEFAGGGFVVGGPVGAVVAGFVGAVVGGGVVFVAAKVLSTPPSVAVAPGTIRAPMGAFSPSVKAGADARAGGKCEYCGVSVAPAKKSEKGVTPPGNQRETDHYTPESKGGTDDPGNAVNSCRTCNGAGGKSDTMPAGTKWELPRMQPPPPPSKPGGPGEVFFY